MTKFQVFGEVECNWKCDENEILIIAGLNRHFHDFDFSKSKELQSVIGNTVDSEKWNHAISRLSKTGKIPLHYDEISLISVTEDVSRCNSPSNSVALFKQLKQIKPSKHSQALRIILLTDFSHSLANVAAVARSSSDYSRKTGPDHLSWTQISLHLHVINPADKKLNQKDVEFLNHLAASIRRTAALIETPANELTTDGLVNEAKDVATKLGCKITLTRGKELLDAGFGGIYHVGKAGPTPPAFVVISHQPKGATKNIVLVGKGVVYDTGGFSLKPANAMPAMKIDMSGAAGLLHSFSALVASGFKENLHVCMCIVENNVSPDAIKPDDVITLLSGKTVEVNNTDCEGRLILADGVYYAKNNLKADTIIDMATLTNGMLYIGGKHHAAIMSNLEDVENEVLRAGRHSGDLTTAMLFCPEFHMDDLKSEIADMKNSGMFVNKSPNSCVAACFIGEQIDFGKDLTWIHIDMLHPATFEERATGFGPSLISSLLGKHTDIELLHQH
ncbi:hypothetical protein WR25_04769 [Diploscapter pachys]|uniref:Cytosol aminopeptidase domain-containing protein n=1 Tax=Diploscapter pachys TaxID=2018661 RepID=A0A2A2L3U0_9BILA|nr:hypothetical protein WR25_04769 [Diploscapter pachys]